MEIQLQELIDQIKKDGVKVAEEQATATIEAANAEAERIVTEARAEAERIIKHAKEEQERLARAGEEAIRQAGRNVLISFRDSVSRELNVLVSDEVARLCSSDRMPELIIKVVEALARNPEGDDLTVLLNNRDMATLEKTLLAALKDKLLTGVTLKANDTIGVGFRIGVDHGRAYYDFSAEAITAMMAVYLNPRVAALLKEAGQV